MTPELQLRLEGWGAVFRGNAQILLNIPRVESVTGAAPVSGISAQIPACLIFRAVGGQRV